MLNNVSGITSNYYTSNPRSIIGHKDNNVPFNGGIVEHRDNDALLPGPVMEERTRTIDPKTGEEVYLDVYLKNNPFIMY